MGASPVIVVNSGPAGGGPLRGLRVLDASSLFAGPLVATILGDFGADVWKLEKPGEGDALRTWGATKNGVPLLWQLVGRNKRSFCLNLRTPAGQRVLREAIPHFDVVIENFRPGVLERWGIGWEHLSAINPRLVMVRVTGFGQTGPYRDRAGFGTLAEGMSGFAHVTGEPDGPPTLPPLGLADGSAALAGCYATMFALWEREQHSGKGQVVDVALYEPLMSLVGSHIIEFDQLGTVQQRMGNRAPHAAPRNAYVAADGKWLVLSAPVDSIVQRLLERIGRPELIADPRYSSNEARLRHAEQLDALIQGWIGERSRDEVMRCLADVGVAIAPVYDASDIVLDAHFTERQSVVSVPHPDLGDVRMQNVFPLLSRTPGRISTPAPRVGEHSDAFFSSFIGMSPNDLAALRSEGVT